MFELIEKRATKKAIKKQKHSETIDNFNLFYKLFVIQLLLMVKCLKIYIILKVVTFKMK